MDYLSNNRVPETAVACGLGAFAEMKGRIRMIMAQSARPSLPRWVRAVMVFVAIGVLAVFPSLTERDARAGSSTGAGELTFTGDTISLTLDNADLVNVLRMFAKTTDVNFVVDPGTFAAGLLDTTVSIDAVQTPWDQVLNEILLSKGLSWTLEGNVLWIHPQGTVLEGDRDFTGDPINLTLEDANLKDVLSQFEKITGLTINLQPGIQRSVTVDLHHVPWDQVLDLILRISGLGWSLDGSTVDVFPATTALGKQLAEKRPTEFRASPAGTAVVGSLDDSPVYRYKVGGAVTEPRRISGSDPVYPPKEKESLVEGNAVVEVLIDSEGFVRDVSTIRGSSDEFCHATIEAVKSWQFEPATLEGKPVPVRYVLATHFSLE
jgi:TonB family protein